MYKDHGFVTDRLETALSASAALTFSMNEMGEVKASEKVVVEIIKRKLPSMKRGNGYVINCLFYECPIKDRCSNQESVIFRENTGWSNPY